MERLYYLGGEPGLLSVLGLDRDAVLDLLLTHQRNVHTVRGRDCEERNQTTNNAYRGGKGIEEIYIERKA